MPRLRTVFNTLNSLILKHLFSTYCCVMDCSGSSRHGIEVGRNIPKEQDKKSNKKQTLSGNERSVVKIKQGDVSVYQQS